MDFKLSDYFSPFEFFSAIVPGGIGTFILWTLLQNSSLVNKLPSLSGTPAWIAFVVISFILGYVIQPPAHILNIAYDNTYRAYHRRKGDPYLDFAKAQLAKESPVLLETNSVYEWAKTKVQAKDPLADKHIGTMQGISKMFRSLCLFVIVGMIVALVLGQWIIGLGLLGMAGLFFYIFCERRWATSMYVYQRLRELESKNKKAKTVKPKRT
jgi:hypothetical protein